MKRSEFVKETQRRLLGRRDALRRALAGDMSLLLSHPDARSGDEIVGISLLAYPPVRGIVVTEWTGTARSVRGEIGEASVARDDGPSDAANDVGEGARDEHVGGVIDVKHAVSGQHDEQDVDFVVDVGGDRGAWVEVGEVHVQITAAARQASVDPVSREAGHKPVEALDDRRCGKRGHRATSGRHGWRWGRGARRPGSSPAHPCCRSRACASRRGRALARRA